MKISEIEWVYEEYANGDDKLFAFNLPNCGGRITVLDRMTGWSDGRRDTETGYREVNGKFWLASGNWDIREFGDMLIEDAVESIKLNSNTCVGV